MVNMYVVIGTTGEYAVRREWLVCVYADETQAQLHVERATEHARLALLDRQSHHQHGLDTGGIMWTNPYDPDMQMSYDGASYRYESCPVVPTVAAFIGHVLPGQRSR